VSEAGKKSKICGWIQKVSIKNNTLPFSFLVFEKLYLSFAVWRGVIFVEMPHRIFIFQFCQCFCFTF